MTTVKPFRFGVQSRSADLISPAATLASEIRTLDTASTVPVSERYLALGARPVELVVRKNHVGPTGIVPLAVTRLGHR